MSAPRQTAVEAPPADSAGAGAGASAPAAELLTAHVALDAEVFRGEGLDFDSARLTALARHAAEGRITVYVTDVHEKEVRRAIGEAAAAARGALRNKEFRKKTSVLRHVPPYDALLRGLDPKVVATALEKQFDDFLRTARVERVPCGAVALGPILDDYFGEAPPFELGELKKSEFPDAIAVRAIADRARRDGISIYFVSNDGGAGRAAESTGVLHPLTELDELNTMLAVVEARSTELVERVGLALRATWPAVEARLVDLVSSFAFVLDTDEVLGEVDDVVVERAELRDASLLDMEGALGGTFAHFLVTAEVSVDAAVSYDDPEATVYDEGERLVFNTISGRTTDTVEVEAEVRLTVDLSNPGASRVDSVEVDSMATLAVSLDNFEPEENDHDFWAEDER